ncbi:hypothetical protein BGX38DRAFT_1269037 [Terfezia claveryi]|nr:hypothetical protein BGX38DRAFT_1269037 [Terfezia claveryi]
MTASSKKKREKRQKDFQACLTIKQPKLTKKLETNVKVGKAKAKPSNFTDSAFKYKALVTATQSLHLTAPSQAHLLTHHLSLLTHHSDTTYRELLSYLTTHLPPSFLSATQSLDNGRSTLPASVLIPALAPMILDAFNIVRSQLLTLLKKLSKYGDVCSEAHALHYLSYDTFGARNRRDSTKYLIWLLGINRDSALRNGGPKKVGKEEGKMNLEARRRWLVEGPGKDALGSVRLGVEGVRKEGNEMGRLGAIAVVLDDALNTEVEEE